MKEWTRNFDNAPKFKSDAYYKVIVKDLEDKNKVLHKCAYTAHTAVSTLLSGIDSMELNEVALSLDDIKRDMERILSTGTEEKVEIVTPSTEIVT